MRESPIRIRCCRPIRSLLAGVMLVTCLPACTPGAWGYGAPRVDFSGEMARATRAAVDAERARHGLDPLAPAPLLRRIAEEHTAYLLRNGIITHRGKDGALVEGRFERAGIDWREAGENLARNRGFANPVVEAVRGWLDSPSHRENLLNPRFRETGLAVALDPETGYIYFTQVFLRRMPK